MNQKNPGKGNPIAKTKNLNIRIFIVAGILLAALSAFLFWPSAEPAMLENSITTAPGLSSTTPPADKEKLVGRWQRTDGGYIIELKNPGPEGKIDAGYFNPNPIIVGKTAWQNKEGRIIVMVELQDQNYPGSLYNLEYQPQGDMLIGTYFQAVERVSYNVEFIRLQK